jgi:hypothetical protein
MIRLTERFNGVTTKYLDNYLIWFRFLELHKQLDTKTRMRSMVLDACKKTNFNTIEQFKMSQAMPIV